MAPRKKYYAVKKGSETGIFTSWEECKEKVNGYPEAEYKGFGTKEEACEYLGIECGEAKIENQDNQNPDMLLSYVDGSYSHSLKKYAFGCVFILPDGRIFTEFGNGDNPESLKQRNVTGEMLGAMYAVRFAIKNGFHAIEICYDYQGIESWVTGDWKSKNELTQKYAASMKEWGKTIKISFTKVTAHTNVIYNELADQTAKKGLTEGKGIPAVRLLAEMEEYSRIPV